MKLTQEILKRYLSGQSSLKEIRQVEEWRDGCTMQEDKLPERLLNEMKSNVWNRMQVEHNRGLAPKRMMEVRMLKFLPWVAAAAVFLSAGIASLWMAGQGDRGIAQGGLVITSATGITTVSETTCKLNFSGYLQLVNASTGDKFIECGNGQRYKLAPGRTYYLETIRGRHHLIDDCYLLPTDNYLQFVRGEVEVIRQTI